MVITDGQDSPKVLRQRLCGPLGTSVQSEMDLVVCPMSPVLSASIRDGVQPAAGACPKFASRNQAQKPSKAISNDFRSPDLEENSALCQSCGNPFRRRQEVLGRRTIDENPSFIANRERGLRIWRVAAHGPGCQATSGCSASAEEIHLDASQGIGARSPTRRPDWRQGIFQVSALRGSATVRRSPLREPVGNFSRSPTPATSVKLNSAGPVGESECQVILSE